MIGKIINLKRHQLINSFKLGNTDRYEQDFKFNRRKKDIEQPFIINKCVQENVFLVDFLFPESLV